MGTLLQGLTMGLAYVAPIGLQNLFVINGALTLPRRRALLTAVIVIFFDVTLALACFFGVGAVMEHIPLLQKIILLAGSLIVIAIGVGLLRSKAEEIDQPQHAPSVRRTITTACVVTWFNPQAIIDGTMMLGAFRASLPAGQTLPFIGGVCLASCLWFTGLTLAVNLLGDRLNAKILRGINVVCGAVIVVYGVKLFLNFLALMGL